MPEKNCICNLPDELLLKIVQYMSPLQSDPNNNPRISWGVQRLPLSDYRSVSLVCRRLNRVVTGVMYAHYDHESDYVSSALFIRTLVQNPLLAQNLKSLKEIGPSMGDTGVSKVEPYKRSAPIVEYLCAAVQQLYRKGPDVSFKKAKTVASAEVVKGYLNSSKVEKIRCTASRLH